MNGEIRSQEQGSEQSGHESATDLLPTLDSGRKYSVDELIKMVEKRFPKLALALRLTAVVGILTAPAGICGDPQLTLNHGYNPDNSYTINSGLQEYKPDYHPSGFAVQPTPDPYATPNTNNGILQPNVVLPDNSTSAPPAPGQP